MGQPQSLVSYHLGKLRDARLVSARRSSADPRDAYYTVDLTRLGELLAATGGDLHPACVSPRISLRDRVRELCPEFPGSPETIHWSIPEPAAATADSDDEASYPAYSAPPTSWRPASGSLLAALAAPTTPF